MWKRNAWRSGKRELASMRWGLIPRWRRQSLKRCEDTATSTRAQRRQRSNRFSATSAGDAHAGISASQGIVPLRVSVPLQVLAPELDLRHIVDVEPGFFTLPMTACPPSFTCTCSTRTSCCPPLRKRRRPQLGLHKPSSIEPLPIRSPQFAAPIPKRIQLRENSMAACVHAI